METVMENSMMQCKHCQRETKIAPHNHKLVLNLLLTACTFGLWLPIWIWMLITPKKPVCAVCGKSSD